MADELPVLETKCEKCGGAGLLKQHMVGRTIYQGGSCHSCGGGGYIPTPAGEAILLLVKHAQKSRII